MTAINCQHLVKTFQQGDTIIKGLDDVSLNIKKGEFLCLAGASGSGKSTLLNAIGGLDNIDSGEITLDEKRTDNMSLTEKSDFRLHEVGFVFQAYNLIPVLSAKENVEFVMQLQGVNNREREQRSMAILKEVGLEGMEHRRPAELSGGQQQRVAVARAVVTKPSIILADEPTANLDSASSKQLLKLFQAMNQEHNITFIVASHDALVINFAPRLIRMEDGRIISDEANETSFYLPN